jgi:hypothetical protein
MESETAPEPATTPTPVTTYDDDLRHGCLDSPAADAP